MQNFENVFLKNEDDKEGVDKLLQLISVNKYSKEAPEAKEALEKIVAQAKTSSEDVTEKDLMDTIASAELYLQNENAPEEIKAVVAAQKILFEKELEALHKKMTEDLPPFSLN